MEKKYNISDLKKLISENKSTDEIGIIYNVSGRTVRNWFSKEGLVSNVRTKGFTNIINLTSEQKEKRIKNIVEYNKSKSLASRVNVECEQCKINYNVKPSLINSTRFCSSKCKYDFLLRGNPENHPRWLGGKTQENQIGRTNLEYCEWRIKVYRRDRFTCKNCGSVGKNLNAHHIESWAKNIDIRYSVDNGITLCRCCHKFFHELYGNNVNRNMLHIFLNEKYIKTTNGWKRTNLESF